MAKKYLARSLDLTYKNTLTPLLLEILVQTAVIADDDGQWQTALELLAFSLVHPGLDKAETEGRAKGIWNSITDRLSSETIDHARQQGEQKALSQAVAEASQILTYQGEDRSHELNRLPHRISQ